MAQEAIRFADWEEQLIREAEAIQKMRRFGVARRNCSKRPEKTIVATVRNRDRRGNYVTG